VQPGNLLYNREVSPGISVIVPVKDVALYIKEAIRSILNQTIDDFELLVIDDHSTDGTLDAVRGFKDPRIKVVKSPGPGIVAH